MNKFTKSALTALGLAGLVALSYADNVKAAEVEVLHWWTAGGEAAALEVLKKDLESKGITWKDAPVAGGAGENAMTVLRARVTSGNSPTAVQMLGFDILDWTGGDNLANLNDVAEAENWNTVVPAAIQKFSKANGNWIAAPVNVHSTNWVWANKKILDDLGIAQPSTWDEFVAALEKVKASGKVALAHGGQPWQDATVFEALVMAVGGAPLYKAAIIDQKPEALSSDQIKQAFDRLGVLRGYFDPNFSGRDWNLASAMVINGEAAFQLMGDWAKGEFINAGKVPGKDFLCFRFPGTQGLVTFNSDQFVMFKVNSKEAVDAQKELAKSVMSPKFQSAFNVVKGSVPARTDVPNTAFDDCAKKGMLDLAEAAKSDKLLGSLAHGYGAPAAVKGAVFDVVTAFVNGEYDSAKAATELAKAVALARK